MDIKDTFKYSLAELHLTCNDLVIAIKDDATTEAQRDGYIAELLELTKELTINNCKNFICKYNATELELDEAFVISSGLALFRAIEKYDPSKGAWFLTYWHKCIESCLINEFKRLTTKKAKFNREAVFVGGQDHTVEGEAEILINTVPTDQDMAEEVCGRITMESLIDRFVDEDKHGFLIRVLIKGGSAKDLSTALNSAEYGARERKVVQRTKERFAKFLINNGVRLSLK